MKRLVSLLTAVLFLFTMLPVGALADGAGTFTVKDSLGAALEENDIIDTVEGVLTLVVGNASEVDLDGITISDYNGAVVAEKKTDTEIEVKFGRLAEGAHTLTVGENVFAFTAEKKYLTNVDFDTYSDTDDLSVKLESDKLGAIYSSYTNYDGYKYGRIKTFPTGHDQVGHKYLSLHADNSGDDSFGKNKTLGLVVRGDLKDEAGEYYLPDGNFNSLKNVNGDKVYVMDAGEEAATGRASAFGSIGHAGTPSTKTILLTSWKPYTGAGTWSEGPNITGTIDNVDPLRYPRLVLVREGEGLGQHLYYKGKESGQYEYVGKKTGYVTNSTTTIDLLTAVTGNSAWSTGAHSTHEQQISWVKCYPERLLSILKIDDMNTTTNDVVIHLSDDVTGTADAIVVKKDGAAINEKYDVTLDNDKRTITLTFEGGLKAGTYDVDISALYGSNNLKAYTGTKSFTLDSDVSGMAMPAPVVNGLTNGTIETIAGGLTLTFDKEIDSATIGGITITNLKGKLVKEIDADNAKVVNLKFGRLEEGVTYTLNVPETVKNVNGATSTELTVDFTATKTYFTNTTFDEAEFGTTTDLGATLADKNLASMKHWSSHDASNAQIVADGDNKYLQISATHNNVTNGLVLSSDVNLNSDAMVSGNKVFVVDSSLNTTSSGSNRYGILATGSAAVSADTAIFASGNSYGTLGNSVDFTNTDISEHIYLNSNNKDTYSFVGEKSGSITWRKPRLVLKRDSDGNLRSDVYDMARGGAYVGVGSYKTSSTATVKEIGIFTEWTASNANKKFMYDNIVAYSDMLPGVLAVEEATDKITFHMSDDIKVSDDAELEEILVIKQGDKELKKNDFIAEYNDNDRTIAIEFPYYGGTFSIDMSALKSEAGFRMYSEEAVWSFDVNGISAPVFCSVTDEGETEITDTEILSAATKLKVTATPVGLSDEFVSYLAVYAGNELITAVPATKDGNGNITATTETFTDAPTQAKLFVWESVDSLRPLAKAVDCLRLN